MVEFFINKQHINCINSSAFQSSKQTLQFYPNFQLPSTTMNQNEYGQGASHAVGDSKVPHKAQEAVPQGLEESLPNKVHDTGSNTGRQTHAKDGGAASKVPLGIQKAVPEKLERALPNSIHDTGDKH
jgi:hypothetical protein